MVKLPKRLRIGSFIWKMRYDNDSMAASGATGATLADQLTILIQTKGAGNAKQIVQDSVLHETLHAIWSQTYLKKDYPDEGNEAAGEKIIAELSPHLLAMLRDNPDLVKFLVS